jgi:acyl-CoA reductase-like NAD-dependent aldehyde dehydrogenase
MNDMSTLTAAPDLAVAVACRRRQTAWGTMPVRERLKYVSIPPAPRPRADEMADAIGRDVGKTRWGLAGDVIPLADACLYERQASRLLRPRRVTVRQRPLWLFGETDTIHRRPGEVVGIIGTWNYYPLLLNGGQILQALVAGNAVV